MRSSLEQDYNVKGDGDQFDTSVVRDDVLRISTTPGKNRIQTIDEENNLELTRQKKCRDAQMKTTYNRGFHKQNNDNYVRDVKIDRMLR